MDGALSGVGLSCLPTEILLHILDSLGTTALLPLAVLSRRFHDVIVRILHHRLSLAVSFNAHSVVLECYPPSRKLYESDMHALYLGTDGLDEVINENNRFSPDERLRKLNGLYSRFRPYRRVVEKQVLRRHPAGDIPGSRTYRPESEATTRSSVVPSGLTQPNHSDGAEQRTTTPEISHHEPATTPIATTLIHFDAGDLFAQLCASVTVSIFGTTPNNFRGHQGVKEGVLRVWRHWLTSRATALPEGSTSSIPLPSSSRCQREATTGKSKDIISSDTADFTKDPNYLWINNGRSVGIRFSVHEKKPNPSAPIIGVTDEEAAASYGIRYEELLVRTRDLLLASEKLHDLQSRESGTAIVFGRWSEMR